jgi:hypothetical protein
MTDAQLELASRQYCRLINQDADEMVEGANVPTVTVPRWTLYAPKIKQVWVVQEAIMFALKP